MNTRWLVRLLLAGAVGSSLPAAAPAQTAPSAGPPAEATTIVIPGAAQTTAPQVIIVAPAPRSERFHLLPQSWRESISHRFSRAPAAAPAPFIEMPVEMSNEPPKAAAPVVPVSAPAPARQVPPMVQPDPLGSTVMMPSQGPPPVAPILPDNWSSPPEPPLTTEPPLPLRDPSMAWSKQAVSLPSPLPPPNAPPYPRFYLLPEGVRTTLGKCLNRSGMACYADRDTPGCGSWRQEFLFVFGSCHYFFGEKCFPDY